jgi:hypothetical protein
LAAAQSGENLARVNETNTCHAKTGGAQLDNDAMTRLRFVDVNEARPSA